MNQPRHSAVDFENLICSESERLSLNNQLLVFVLPYILVPTKTQNEYM